MRFVTSTVLVLAVVTAGAGISSAAAADHGSDSPKVQRQDAAAFERALGMPLMDAGGGRVNVALSEAAPILEARLAGGHVGPHQLLKDPATGSLIVVLDPGAPVPSIQVSKIRVRYMHARFPQASAVKLDGQIVRSSHS